MIKICLIDADSIIYFSLSSKKDEPLKTLEEAKEYIDKFIKGIMSYTHSTHYILTLTIGRNFRYEVDSNYKADRIGKDKHPLFYDVRDYLITKYKAYSHSLLESDDIVWILKNKLENSFIAACDSDILEGLPGKHFNYKQFKWVETTKEQAKFKFWHDLIAGTHNGVKGLFKKGTKYATSILNNIIGMDISHSYIVLHEYIIHYKSEKVGKEEFEKNYKLLRLLDDFEGLEIPEPVKWKEDAKEENNKDDDVWI